MADAAQVRPTFPRARQNVRGGRGRGGQGSQHQHQRDTNHRGRGFRGSRAERGGHTRGEELSHSRLPADTPVPQDQLRSSLSRAPDNQSHVENSVGSSQLGKGGQVGENPAEEGEVCFICASTIGYLSIAPCNHQTCHICALRLRALYKKRDCAYCKTEAPFVILTDDAAKRYGDFAETDFVNSDQSLGIKYAKDIILEDTVLLLRYNCPDKDCDAFSVGWHHLHRHVKQKHGKLMCDLCSRNKKVFTHEHELFTFGELRRHEKFGDDNPGAIDQSGFRGHPECGFCRERFYGDDELYQHCREKHERCHICDRRNPGSQVQYYLNYQALEKHFEEAHYVCLDAECQADKTNVFESEMDLKAHQLSSHPNGLSKDARRDARLVNISSFDYRTPYQPQRRGDRDRDRDRDYRGNGRGRDPNSEALPMSSAQPLRRDELAYQRQMAIINAQPQLIPRNHAASPLPRTNPRPEPPRGPVPNLGDLSLDPAGTSQPDHSITPQEQARQVRHTSVLQRASKLLNDEPTKVVTFRTHVSSYRSSTIAATELIDSFFSLFDAPSAELGKLVHELADIYEEETKRQDLLKAWNDWLSINADYPSLPGPSGVFPGADSGGGNGEEAARPGGRRVLRLKSSTAQSSRSAVSRQGSWGNALADNRSGLSTPKPSSVLGGASSLSNGQKRAPWTGVPTASSAPRPSTANGQSLANPRPPPTMGAKANEEMFPALPTGRKPNTLIGGLTKGAVRWDDAKGAKVSGGNPWGGGASGQGTGAADAADEGSAEAVNAGGTGKKGKKGKQGKQVLYKFG